MNARAVVFSLCGKSRCACVCIRITEHSDAIKYVLVGDTAHMLFLSGQVVVSHADEPVLIPPRLAQIIPTGVVHLKYIYFVFRL